MFSVVIATIRPNTLPFSVRAVRRQTREDWELIIVGQGADPALASFATQMKVLDSRIRYIHLDKKGVSGARNAGIQAAKGDWIAITDDDCEPAPDWLETIAACATSVERLHLVGGSLIVPPRPFAKIATCPGGLCPKEVLYDPAATPQCAPSGWDWCSANFAISRELVGQIGFFDEYLGPGTGAYFPAAEDTDYKLRIESAGLRMLATPRSVVHHTYGYRYGIKAVMNLSRNYARGNGGLAGKLTLLGDPRGSVWLRETKQKVCYLLRQPRQIYRLPFAFNRLRHFTHAYHDCLAHFTINQQTGLLQPL